MSVVVGILALLGALAPLLVWLVKRWGERREDPATQNRKRYEQAELDIARRDGPGASRHGLDDLDELDRLRRSKSDPQ
jgi:hypothetical protein